MKQDYSRRDFIKYMAVLGLASFISTPLYAKTTKESVKYQNSPHDGNKCKDCMYFIPETNECKLVEGSIDPNGWCSLFFKNQNLNTPDKNNSESIS